MDLQTITAKRQDLFFQHLIALEFDAKSLSMKYKVKFEKKMFCLPNRTAFEVVSHFLFSKLNEVSKKQYQIVWPLLDIKQHTEFQKTCFTHLSTIAKESEIIFPRVNSTVLSSYGEAFYELYFAFSTHVIMETNKSYKVPMLRRTKRNIHYHDKIIEILQINTISSVEKFRDLAKLSHQNLESYFNCAKNLMTIIEKLRSSNASKQSLLELKIQQLSSTYFAGNNSLQNVIEKNGNNSVQNITGKAAEKSVEYVEKVKQFWKTLEDFLTKEEKFWNYISTEIDEKFMKYVLKGEECKPPVPNVMKEACDAETLKAVSLEETKELCIFRFLKLFKAALEFHVNNLKKTKLSKLTLTETLKDTSKLEHCLKMLRSLSDSLNKDNELSRSDYEEFIKNLDVQNLLETEMVLHEDLPPSPNKCHQTCNINNFISIFGTPLATEAANINLLESRHNNEEDNITEMLNICKDNSRIQEDNIQTSLSLEDNHLNFFPDKADSFIQDSCANTPFTKQNTEPNLRHENESPVVQNLLCETEFSNELFRQHLDELENPIVDISRKFNIRQSLLLEESLNSQTLNENISFLD